MAAPMDVVFSFDTTGSMSQVLDEVKCRLNDLIQRLQGDIPQFKVGIIAHGDYCDKDHFYDIRTLDLTDNLPDVVNFVSETTGTEGGDIPECYELSLRHARDMSWREGSRRVFVVIGDAYPHEPDYALNTMKIDWQDELSSLVEKSVTIYGVQYGHNPESVSFFQRLTGQSGGQHLRLQDMGDICHAIMAICYREQGPDLLQTYEAEVRADNDDPALKSGLENMFNKLGRSDSLPAPPAPPATATPLVKKPSLALLSTLSKVSSIRSDCSADTAILNASKDNSDRRNIGLGDRTSTPINMDNQWLSDDDDDDTLGSFRIIFPKRGKKTSAAVGTAKQLKRKREDSENSFDNGRSSPKKAKLVEEASNSSVKSNGVHKVRKPITSKNTKPCTERTSKNVATATKEKKSQILPRSKRDAAGDKQFRFNDLPWSKWHLAATQEVPENSGIWKTVAQRGCGDTFWRIDLLRYCETKWMNDLLLRPGKELRSRGIHDTTCSGALFEVGVISPDSRNIRSVWLHATNQRKTRSAVPKMLSKPWYSELTRPISEPLTAAVKAGSRVYLRWAVVKDVQTVKREILHQYDYLWRS